MLTKPDGPWSSGPPASCCGPRILGWSAGYEAGCRHGPRHGVATRLRRRADLEAHPQQRERRQEDRYLRRLRSDQPDRLRDSARRRHRRHLQSRPVDGAEGPAQGRRFHHLRDVRGAPGARRRQLASRDRRRPLRHRHHDRLRHRRAVRHRRYRAAAEGARTAQGVAVLHSRPPDQSRLGLCLDRARPQGSQPCGGDRLFDRRACDRRCQPADRARRCRRDGGRRHRIADLPAGDGRAFARRARCRPASTKRRKRPRGPTTRIATAS